MLSGLKISRQVHVTRTMSGVVFILQPSPLYFIIREVFFNGMKMYPPLSVHVYVEPKRSKTSSYVASFLKCVCFLVVFMEQVGTFWI